MPQRAAACPRLPAATEEALPSIRLTGRNEVRALPAAYSRAESPKPAYRIKRKAAPRAAATSRLIELGIQG